MSIIEITQGWSYEGFPIHSLVKNGQELVDISIVLGDEDEFFHIQVYNGKDGQNPNTVVAEIKMKFADFEKKQEEGE